MKFASFIDNDYLSMLLAILDFIRVVIDEEDDSARIEMR